MSSIDEQINYSFLLLTHMVCADRQIHSKELKYLHKIEQQAAVGENTKKEKEKILSQDENLISIEVASQRIPHQQRSGLMRQLIEMAFIDGFSSPEERQIVQQLRQIWNLSREEIQRYEECANSTAQDISDDNKVNNSLWNDSDYQNAIRTCTLVAHEDYQFTDSALTKTEIILNNLIKGIQNKLEAISNKSSANNASAETAQEVAKQLQTTKQSLEAEIVKNIKSVRESLDAKKRAINYFTIAFIGKTKAGKSTLHAIMTGEGWDAIGVGKQRTTRLNRVYEWNNIRIIDTPGIGAPDGKTDEEIAQSVIHESDVICYVVTNDSIQETEFKFLKLLKENAKPLIILLNVHKNFRDSRRGNYELERFLQNPDKLFAMDGSSGMSGHIERIRRYAQQYYGNDYFQIVPVMLLAAQLSCEPEHQHHKDQLFNASRMQSFYDDVRQSLVEHGAIRRSQTLLGCTVCDIEKPYQWVAQQTQNYKTLTNTLKNKRATIRKDIQKAANDARDSLNYQIESIFQDALNAIPSFAEDYWNCSKSSMEQGWEQKLKKLGFEERINTAYQKAVETFSKEVQASLEEIGKELQIIAQLGGVTFNFNEQDSGDERNFFRIGGGILAVAAAVMMFIPPLAIAGLVIGIVGSVIGVIGNFFKSKDQKRREAVNNISSSLQNQLNNQKQTTISKALEQFRETCDDFTANIDTYFQDLIEGLDSIAQQLESAQSKLEQQVKDLNHAYAKRIIDWCLKRYEPLTREGIDSTIAKVSRDLGRSINIETKVFLQLQRTHDEINRVLQEDICIQIAPSPKAEKNPKQQFQRVVGIDLGTTKSVVAVIENGKSIVIPNKEGFSTTPSVVAYTKDGACLVGQAAKRQAVINPQNTFDSVIRLIGRKYDEVTEQAKQVSYKILQDTQGKVKIDCPVLRQLFTPEEMLAQILRKLVDDASQYLDAQITQVVLTVPAYFDEIQRHAVKEAGRLANLDVVRIIPNATAAALAYGLAKENSETILVFDLGGGNLSVSILEMGDGVFEVLSYSGDTQLGGNDFDQKIVDSLTYQFRQSEGMALYADEPAWQRLREAAEKAKIELSNTSQTEIDLPWITNTASGPRHLKMTLTRQKFEQLCTDLISRCRVSVENALRDAKLNKSDIDEVILVGGSTRIPVVQEFLRQLFGKPPKQGLNSDELVALGASVEAGVLAGSVTGMLLLDVTPLSLGVETHGGVMTKILSRNTTFPTKKSEVFSTAIDGQTYVNIHVFQGEIEMAKDNKSLGILRLDGIPPAPRGVPQIEVTFDIDANGILNVIAKDKGSGKVQSMTITGASTSSEEYEKHTFSKHEGSLTSGVLAAVMGAITLLFNPFS